MDVAQYRILLDLPSKHPALDFPAYAHALTEIVQESQPPRFAVGIFGSWGSGKTTLMNLIRDGLDPNRTIKVEFSAWRYEKEQHLIVPLLDTIRESLTAWADEQAKSAPVKQAALRTASIVGRATTALLSGFSLKAGVPGMLEATLDANQTLKAFSESGDAKADARAPRSFYHASFRALGEAFQEFHNADKTRRIVVFVDDLDRCLPDGALQVLESMKLFFDFPGFVFVVGLDQQVVAAAVDARFRKDFPAENGAAERVGRGSDYIHKIFQVPFTLAPVDVARIDAFLDAFIQDADPPLAPGQVQDLRNRVEPHLRFLAGGGVNLREIKRFINAYTLLRKSKPHQDADVVLTTQTILFRQPEWEAVRGGLYDFNEEFVRAVEARLAGDTEALAVLGPLPITVPDTFLDYVTPGAPGNALVRVLTPGMTPLADYLSSGAATSYTVDPRLLDLLSLVRRLAPLARAIKTSVDSERVQAADRFRFEVESLSGRIRQEVRDANTATINRDLEELGSIVDRAPIGLPAASPDAEETALDDWIRQATEAINRLARHLQEVLNRSRQ